MTLSTVHAEYSDALLLIYSDHLQVPNQGRRQHTDLCQDGLYLDREQSRRNQSCDAGFSYGAAQVMHLASTSLHTMILSSREQLGRKQVCILPTE